MTHSTTVVVVGYGELGSKSTTVRTRMRRRLSTNLDAVLRGRGLDATIDESWARLYVEGASADIDRCARAASEVPGVVWSRPARRCDASRETIVETLCALARTHSPDETFAVRASTDESEYEVTGSDLERLGGSALLDRVGGRVDLDEPDRVYRIECRDGVAYVSAVQYEGPGGLPAGTQGTVVALVSGGIDSPVAAWQLLRRGCRVVPVYVDLGAYGGADHRERALTTVERLRRRAPNLDTRLRVVPGGPVVERVADELGDTRMLSLRRAMLRMAAVLAEREDAHALATGEAIGQKSSQTGPNLAVTDAAVDYPVHRPLLTWDKADIVACARELGTFDDATLPVGCERIAPVHPETAATRAAVEAAEPDGFLDHAARVAADVEVVDTANVE